MKPNKPQPSINGLKRMKDLVLHDSSTFNSTAHAIQRMRERERVSLIILFVGKMIGTSHCFLIEENILMIITNDCYEFI